MNIILLSGGSGKRLWPLSNDIQSKQFLQLLKVGDGKYESMVQRVMRQLRIKHPDSEIAVACNKDQIAIARRQIDGVEYVAEPSRRDTFPAIALAAAYLRYNKGVGEDEVITVCPIDTFAQDEYFGLLSEVSALVGPGRYSLGLLGVVPTYPSEKYGYILRNGNEVTGFVEKPSEAVARQRISEGALWNCAVFSMRVGYTLDAARKYISFDSYESVFEQYDKLPKISFDYEIAEKEKSIGCITYDGIWKDLGTWNTLTEEMNTSSIGDDVIISDNCQNTHVLNMLSAPIIAQDLRDVVVVASYDGILVSSKSGSSYLKPLTEKVSSRPMYSQCEWGTYRTLEQKQSNGKETIVRRMKLDAGKQMEHKCPGRGCETWVVVSGKGILSCQSEERVISGGDTIALTPDASYSVLAATELELFDIQIK